MNAPADPGARVTRCAAPAILPPRQVTVLAYQGVSLFAEFPTLRAQLPKVDGAKAAVLVPTMREAPDVPSSAMLELLRDYAADLRDAGGRLVLAGVHPHFAELLRRTAIADELGDGCVLTAGPVLLGSVAQAERQARA